MTSECACPISAFAWPSTADGPRRLPSDWKGWGYRSCIRDSRRIPITIFFAGSLNVLRPIAEAPPGHVRLLLGYAGWGPGQLEHEMVEGVWLTAPSSREAIFDVSPDAMWEYVVRSLGIDPATLIQTPGVH